MQPPESYVEQIAEEVALAGINGRVVQTVLSVGHSLGLIHYDSEVHRELETLRAQNEALVAEMSALEAQFKSDL